MINSRIVYLATMIVAGTGALWGFYWFPVRQLAAMDLSGALGTLAITAAATTLLAPFALRQSKQLAQADPVGIASTALGGAAFMLYSVGFTYGRVAIVILLFFLTPVWSTLIGRFLLKQRATRQRIAVIAIGIAGLAVMLGANGTVPIPRNSGEWLGLLSGILWAIGSTGIKERSDLKPASAAFIFAAGACAGSLMLAPLLEPWPASIAFRNTVPIIGWTVFAGGTWWALSVASLMWATARLEPARVGILLMTEVFVGTLSAAVFAGESLTAMEIFGGALVLLAGILEVWPLKAKKGMVINTNMP